MCFAHDKNIFKNVFLVNVVELIQLINPQYESWSYKPQFVKHLRTCSSLCMHKKHFPKLELRMFIKVKTFPRWDARKLDATLLKCLHFSKRMLKAMALNTLNMSLNYNCRTSHHLLNTTITTDSQQRLTRGPVISLLAAFSVVHCSCWSDRSSSWAEHNITHTIIAPSTNNCTNTLKVICARLQPHHHAKDAEM